MNMNASLSQSLEHAWKHMVRVLFRPFDLSKWLVIGFSAWLASFTSCNANLSTSFDGGGERGGDGDSGPGIFEATIAAVRESWTFLVENSWLAVMIFFVALIAAIIAIAMVWISSRAKFIFLDNVIRDQAQVVEPWGRFRHLGNSLFMFYLTFALIQFLVAGGIAGVGFGFFAMFGSGDFLEAPGAGFLVALGVIVGVIILIVWILLSGLIAFFLNAFIVPIMYRFNLGTVAAWEYFLALLTQNPLPFVLCGLVVMLLALVLGIAITTIGCMTCCLGFILLMIPYVGTVVLLPLHVAYRAFTVDFLGQLDPDLRLLPVHPSEYPSNLSVKGTVDLGNSVTRDEG